MQNAEAVLGVLDHWRAEMPGKRARPVRREVAPLPRVPGNPGVGAGPMGCLSGYAPLGSLEGGTACDRMIP